MRIIKVEPRKPAEICEIDGSLESMQEVVGGYIEVLETWRKGVCLICNEEGKILELPQNRAIGSFFGADDIICGTFFLCGAEGEEFTDLTDEDAAFLLEVFKSPEIFYTPA